MTFQKTTLPIKDTLSFSALINDYVLQHDRLKPFITSFPSFEAIQEQMKLKAARFHGRNLLNEVIREQYSSLALTPEVEKNLQLLLQENSFTICTAHQPSVFTGHLYFIYKTIHAIRLCMELNEKMPASHFIPIFFIGSEDNDLDEIGELNLNEKSLTWNTNQKGSCGRMLTADFEELVKEVSSLLNNDVPCEKHLMDTFRLAYNGKNTLSQATRIILNALFGSYGLLVLDADDARLKRQFGEVIKSELLERSSHTIVSKTISQLAQTYKVQASPRELNLFYMHENLRERIEFDGQKWKVLQSEIEFDEFQLLQEVEQHPERFSPNVILRPLYQEMILPNVAFIGGGGELAYWLQLKELFAHNQVPYPLLQLRNSVLWIPSKSFQKIEKLGITITDVFQSPDALLAQRIQDNPILAEVAIQHAEIENKLDALEHLGREVSSSLAESLKAHRSKMQRIEQRIEAKFKSHLKRKEFDFKEQFIDLKSHLFPKGKLQERYDNIVTLIKLTGADTIPLLLEHMEGFGNDFIVLSETKNTH